MEKCFVTAPSNVSYVIGGQSEGIVDGGSNNCDILKEGRGILRVMAAKSYVYQLQNRGLS
jgi:hypothetical protein